MKTAHTKGQWTYEEPVSRFEQTIQTKSGKRIAEVKSFGSGFNDASETERQANAKLIAAAPDLLKACKKALKHHQGGHSEIGSILRNAILKAIV